MSRIKDAKFKPGDQIVKISNNKIYIKTVTGLIERNGGTSDIYEIGYDNTTTTLSIAFVEYHYVSLKDTIKNNPEYLL